VLSDHLRKVRKIELKINTIITYDILPHPPHRALLIRIAHHVLMSASIRGAVRQPKGADVVDQTIAHG
jgi:hypothetical protein